MAFTRANVGYVHAIAHQFGGRYHTPHGLANAIVLPQVLRFLAPAVMPRLAALAVRARLGTVKDNEQVLAQRFLDAVDALNRDLGIPTHLAALREKDIPALAEAALHEAHTGYPVPRYMTRAECESLIRRLLPPKEEAAARPKALRHRQPAARRRRRHRGPAQGSSGAAQGPGPPNGPKPKRPQRPKRPQHPVRRASRAPASDHHGRMRRPTPQPKTQETVVKKVSTISLGSSKQDFEFETQLPRSFLQGAAAWVQTMTSARPGN
jgi:hypothetical protein